MLIVLASFYLHLSFAKSMKRALIFTLTLLLSIPAIFAAETIEEFFEELPVSNIRVLEKESFYGSIYEVMFEQPIDHNDPDKGTFSQRLYVSHYDKNSPVVLSTEGYDAGFYYTTELAISLKCNQIIAEHRYFGKSDIEGTNYKYLTTWQSASDHHRIIEKFKEFYTNKWITTGISKGGQSVIYHSFYYPDDVDARVSYVAPLNFSTEDPRIYNFLDHVGSGRCRRKIERFQKEVLKYQEDYIQAFKELSDKKGYTYEMVGGVETAFEYCVLEYPFAFWQWGYADCSDIPSKDTKPEKAILHMNAVAGFDYFADEFILAFQPHYYQALTEIGYYGYEIDRFKNVLQHVDESGFEFTLPEDMEVSFDPDLSIEVSNYLENEAEDFIFIYGEWDTWSATAVDLEGNTRSKVFYSEHGSHRTRIRHMDFEQQDEIYSLLDSFLMD